MDLHEMAQEAEKQDAKQQMADLVDYGISIRKLPSGVRVDPNDFCQSRASWESKGRLR